MNRLNIVLFVMLLASSVYLVRVSYDARRLYAELDAARNQEKALATEFERLKAERQAQATPLKVERIARERPAMRNATPAVTQYVTHADAAPAAPASGAAR
ncbi:cell division protein FtsL [Piscinibacter aquaticus]|uniref:Cell division protein FtsL n=1 Tax=Piscinibacter aquaticus TaxID=392597 RepID=A0A5C6U0P4_9BURK|nr:cell division protein FtsL [Piscinibacter aquaticus]